jgi:AraC family transcriptional regulator
MTGRGRQADGSFGNRMGELCRADVAPVVVARTLRNTSIVATQLKVSDPGPDKTDPLGIEDAFIAAVTFQEGYFRDNWLDEKPTLDQAPQPAGSVSLMDLRRGNRTRFKSPIDSVQFYFPRRTLNAIADANGLSRVSELQSPLSLLFEEPVFAQIGRALTPAFERPEEASQTFLDHILTGAALHLLSRHGGAVQGPMRSQGGLASWQQKRVIELLEENLDGNLSLNELAEVCRLSPRHFARAFAQSNGAPPYRWLLLRRVERAKELMLATDLSLAEVAERTAFASQSHFTRVFRQQVGESPGGWRRIRRA